MTIEQSSLHMQKPSAGTLPNAVSTNHSVPPNCWSYWDDLVGYFVEDFYNYVIVDYKLIVSEHISNVNDGDGTRSLWIGDGELITVSLSWFVICVLCSIGISEPFFGG